ncbi:aldehyde ferredoxin oxidoreductase family protein [Fundidesulfovibrio soli]|uniref:aldehyde ferredoxin oxidoreductase family protein n=1 Tax=Fundidesulfovibrio soli TaxID=2922716 RepID=UPI001FAF7F08|nr:aldehyde ferredoxin oxidoreductase C-terminal domain-containing protein [Fundidesulfovibrio soli]
MNGWTGKILRVDLTRGTASVETPDQELLRLWIGGRGLAGYYLDPCIHLPWDHPEMPLCLFAGPLTGTVAPSAGRACLASRSPLTGGFFDAQAGGRLGAQLKKAGFDGVVVTGRADTPMGLKIADGVCALEDASGLAGLNRSRLLTSLRWDGAVAATGPAAEHGARMASVWVDARHGFQRGGLGLGWAAKNLKYIAVKDSGRVAVADPAGLKAAREDILRLTAASPYLSGGHGLSRFGSCALYDLMDARSMMPTRNFRASRFAAATQCNAVQLARRFESAPYGCRGCHIRCGRVAADGRTLPDLDALSHFTALLDVANLDFAAQANALCLELGLDPVSTASTLACEAELTGAAPDTARLLAAIEDLAQGRRPDLAQGAAALARSQGRPESAMTVKGLELPAQDPRGAYGLALASAVSPRGGCHLGALPMSHEVLRKPVATDRFSFLGKARIIALAENAGAVGDSLVVCRNIFYAASLEEYGHAFEAVTGLGGAAELFARAGERIRYRECLMNARLGFGAAQDVLPERLFAAPGAMGTEPDARPIPREAFLEARARYYAVRGLDAHGLPTLEKSRELGLLESYRRFRPEGPGGEGEGGEGGHA